MARHGFLGKFEGDETASHSCLFLCQQCPAADEFTFHKADSPVCIGFEWRCVFAHIVAIEQIAHL